MEFLHQSIETDTEVEIRIRDDTANRKVIDTNENKIQIQLDKDIGIEVPEAKLIISSYYLLERLYQKLNKIKSGEQTITNLAEKTFNLQLMSIGHQEFISALEVKELNTSQKQAIELALGSEVSFIWGPPGTGKTQIIPIIIEGFLRRNLSVLLIAHTNVATNRALKKVVEHLVGSEDYDKGRLLRVGAVDDVLKGNCYLNRPLIVLPVFLTIPEPPSRTALPIFLNGLPVFSARAEDNDARRSSRKWKCGLSRSPSMMKSRGISLLPVLRILSTSEDGTPQNDDAVPPCLSTRSLMTSLPGARIRPPFIVTSALALMQPLAISMSPFFSKYGLKGTRSIDLRTTFALVDSLLKSVLPVITMLPFLP